MHNHMHLHDTWEAYRKQVRQLRDGYDTRMKQYFYPELDKSVLFEQVASLPPSRTPWRRR